MGSQTKTNKGGKSMKKLICCSYEPDKPYVMMTINNGVNINKPTHVSGTYIIDRDVFIDACKHREKFETLIGIDIRQGWQNALGDAIDNFKTLEPLSIQKTAQFVIDENVKLHGEEIIAKEIEALEKQTAECEEKAKELKGKKNARTNKTARNRNGGKKPAGKIDNGILDGPVPECSNESGPAGI